jgi:hypothetical protein
MILFKAIFLFCFLCISLSEAFQISDKSVKLHPQRILQSEADASSLNRDLSEVILKQNADEESGNKLFEAVEELQSFSAMQSFDTLFTGKQLFSLSLSLSLFLLYSSFFWN